MMPLPANLASHRFALCASLPGVKNEDLEVMMEKLLTESWNMKIIDKSSSPVQIMLYQQGKPLPDLFKKKVVRTKASLIRQKLPNGKCDVVVSHIENDNKRCIQDAHLYVQNMEDSQQISNLCHKMNTTASAMPPAKEILINSLYCALFSDGLWYRASVDQDLGSHQYLATFIDYGNQEAIDLKNLKELSEELFEFPIYGIPIIPHNLDVRQMQYEKLYPVEVTGEKSGVQIVNILNVEKKLPTLSSIKKTEFEAGVSEALILHFEDGIHYCISASGDEVFAVDEMHEKLKTCPKESVNSEDLFVESVVCAKCSDGDWFRGAVSKISTSTTFVVRFIDIGFSEIVSLENIKKLPEDFEKYALHSVPCRIINFEEAAKHTAKGVAVSLKTVGKSDDGIQMVEIVNPNISHGVKVSSLEKQIIPFNKTVEVRFTWPAGGDIYYCQLASDQDKIKSLEEKLLSADTYESLKELPDVGCVVCAKFSDNIWYRGSVEETFQTSNLCKIYFIDYGNTESISIENIKILPPEVSSFPIFSIPVKLINNEKLQEAVHVQALTDLSAEGLQQIKIVDEMPIYTSIAKQLLSDLPTEVTVCHEESGLYYVQKVTDENTLKEMLINLQRPENLNALSHSPTVGEIVSAKSSVDACWYRGRIEKDCGNDLFKVFYLDYGNTEEISKKHVCHLPPVCASVPVLSIPVKLSDSNKHTACLSVDSKYFMKCVNTMSDDVQVVKVRPSSKPVLASSFESSTLEENLTLVRFHNSAENCHFLTKCSDVERINEMNRLLEEFESEDIFDAPVVNEILIVKGTNKSWSRGCVQDIKPGYCRVLLVDKGITEDIPYSDICYMPEQLISFPFFNIVVSLDSNVEKVDVEKECVVQVVSREGNTPLVKIMPQFLLNSLEKQHLPIQDPKKVQFCYCDGEIFFLQIVDQLPLLQELSEEVKTHSPSIVHKARVGELLVGQSSSDCAYYRCCVEEVVSCDMFKVNFIDYGNCEVLSKDKLHYFSDKLFNYPPLCIAVKIDNLSATVELEKENTVLAESLPENNEPQVVKLILETVQPQIPSLSNESAEDGDSTQKYFEADMKYVPFPSGEQDIFIYSVVAPERVYCAPYSEENILASTKLLEEMNQYCENLNVSTYEGEPPLRNEMVLAKYEGDWCRAAIIEVRSPSSFEVLFVDYGNTEVLSPSHLRKMIPAFMSLSIQAHFCCLTGFEYEETDTERIIQEISANFVYRSLRGVASNVQEETHVQISCIPEHLREKHLIIS